MFQNCMLYQNVGELQKIVRQSQTETLSLERIFAKYHKVIASTKVPSIQNSWEGVRVCVPWAYLLVSRGPGTRKATRVLSSSDELLVAPPSSANIESVI